jgi:hypothetical protein
MSEFLTFLRLGAGHITAPGAADHILFLVALAAVYRFRDWRHALWTVSAFTVGHTVSLGMAVADVVSLPSALIEFLIPVTIVVTCVENIFAAQRERTRRHWYRPILAGVFGLIHGAGFANYLRELFVENIGVPLLGFNVGIELGQLLVISGIALVFFFADRLGTFLNPEKASLSILRFRAVAASIGVGVFALRWAAMRAPW